MVVAWTQVATQGIRGWILIDSKVVLIQFADRFYMSVRGREDKFLPTQDLRRVQHPLRKMAFVNMC